MEKRKIAAAFITAAAILCSGAASCEHKHKIIDKAPDASQTTKVPHTAPVHDPSLGIEESVAAASGDAYLAINDGKYWIQYFGDNTDPEHTMLSYNAGVVPITGDGEYTVSVTADTRGFRYDTTSDPDDAGVTPSGIQFLAVMIKDGETLFPGAVIDVSSVKVDGKSVTLISKPYTTSDDGKEMRANIFNQWVGDKPSKNARSVDGALFDENGEPTEACAKYSPITVNTDDFKTWKNVEITFTVTGTGK